MTDTADSSLLSVDERAASPRSFFDVEASTVDAFPPPAPPFPTASMPVAAGPAGAPQLPRVNPSVAAAAPASPFAFSSLAGDGPASGPTRKAPAKRGGRRFVSWCLILAVIGGGVYAGITYGPDLLDRANGDATADEPEAPLAFPPVTPGAIPPRTATFTVERHEVDSPTGTYEMTNDFETGVSRLLVERDTSPDIEMLAVFDIANVRQVDQQAWTSIPRGEFPLVGAPERQRWLRTIDEYFPAAMRPFITIDRASESVIGTEPMRHLVVTVDSAAVARLAVDPITGTAIPPASVAEFQLPAHLTATPGLLGPMTVEVWVDANGLIRKLVEPAEISDAIVTVTSVSPDPFSPTFPAPEAVTPLTAGQLVDLRALTLDISYNRGDPAVHSP